MNAPPQSISRPGHPTKVLRIGVRAHDFGRMPAAHLAARIAAKGFDCAQLALNKAIPGLNLQAEDLNGKVAREIGDAFRREGVEIAVLGCYINPIHPDSAVRRQLLGYFKDHLRFARDFGCGLVGLESGSLNADYSPHPGNQSEAAFATLLGSLEELVGTADEFGVDVGLEAVTSHTVSTPEKMRRVLDCCRSPRLKVIFDPVNLLCAANASRQSEIIGEAMELFGDRVAVVHAKDFLLESGVMRTVPAGCGQLDYGPVMSFIHRHTPATRVLLEETGETLAEECAGFLRQKWLESDL